MKLYDLKSRRITSRHLITQDVEDCSVPIFAYSNWEKFVAPTSRRRVAISKTPFLQGMGSVINIGGNNIFARKIGVSDIESICCDWQNVGRAIKLSTKKI